jgi:hypothetical protein
MFIGGKYCSLGVGRRVGYHLSGVQELALGATPSALIDSTDTLLILTPSRTERVALYSNINAGEPTYGEYYPVLDTPATVDSQVGVVNGRTIAPYTNSSFFAQCSDGSVRLWDGSAWSLDLTRGRIESLVRRSLQDGWGISSSNGVYYLYSSSAGILRLSVQEKAGNGWCTVSSDGAPTAVFPLLLRGSDGERMLLVPKDGTEPPVEIEHDTTDAFHTDDMVCRFSTREIEGSLSRYYVRHLRTTVKFVPLPGKTLSDFAVKFILFVDGSATASQECRFDTRTNTAIFSGDSVGNRFRVECETSKGGFFISSIQTEFQSMDSRNLAETTTEGSYDEELNSNLVVWLNRANPLEDACRRVEVKVGSLGTLASTPGYDGYATSAVISGNSSPLILGEGTELGYAPSYMAWIKVRGTGASTIGNGFVRVVPSGITGSPIFSLFDMATFEVVEGTSFPASS